MNLANKITLSRLLLIPLFLFFLSPVAAEWGIISTSGSPYAGAAIFLLAAITDKLDGYVARKYNQVTSLGTLLDPLVDKLLICAALIVLVANHKIGAWIALIIIGREIVVTALRFIATTQKIILAADNYGRIKMVFQVIAILLVMLNEQKIVTAFYLDQVMLFAAVILTLFSGINYFMKNKEVFAG